MKPIYFAVLMFIIPLILAGCLPQADTIVIKDAYAYATPKTMPAAAIFMTIDNHADFDDEMIGFKIDIAARSELHTMETVNDIMKMRQVEGYKIPSGQSHSLKPMSDHIMIFDMTMDLAEDDKISAVAVFEKAGEIPVSITIKPRQEMMKHMH